MPSQTPDFGELVDEEVERVDKLGKSWEVSVRVYYTGKFYNVGCIVEETNTGFLEKPEKHSTIKRCDNREEINETAQSLISKLFGKAKRRSEAREIDLHINVQ